MNKLQWNLNRNSYIFIQENAFENVVWKRAGILFRPQYHNESQTMWQSRSDNGIPKRHVLDILRRHTKKAVTTYILLGSHSERTVAKLQHAPVKHHWSGILKIAMHFIHSVPVNIHERIWYHIILQTNITLCILSIWYFIHDDVVKWKHFPGYCPFVRGIHRSPVNSPHKSQWRGVSMFSLICAWINGWVNNREAGDLRHHHAYFDIAIMICYFFDIFRQYKIHWPTILLCKWIPVSLIWNQ